MRGYDMTFTKSETKMIDAVKRVIPSNAGKRYDFWLIYDDSQQAIDYEGGFEIYDPDKDKPTDGFTPTGNNKFRNQYSLLSNRARTIIQNW